MSNENKTSAKDRLVTYIKSNLLPADTVIRCSKPDSKFPCIVVPNPINVAEHLDQVKQLAKAVHPNIRVEYQPMPTYDQKRQQMRDPALFIGQASAPPTTEDLFAVLDSIK